MTADSKVCEDLLFCWNTFEELEKGLLLLEQLVEAEDDRSMSLLALLFEYGLYVNHDLGRSKFYHTKSKHYVSRFVCVLHGWGVEQDKRGAQSILQTTDAQLDPLVQLKLVGCLEHGKMRNYEKARHILDELTSAGNMLGQIELAKRMLNNQDERERALEMFSRLYHRGYFYASRYLRKDSSERRTVHEIPSATRSNVLARTGIDVAQLIRQIAHTRTSGKQTTTHADGVAGGHGGADSAPQAKQKPVHHATAAPIPAQARSLGTVMLGHGRAWHALSGQEQQRMRRDRMEELRKMTPLERALDSWSQR
eukprot:TRINITY_DN5045_c0_g2_i1.p1 TRINITY_DN5045_c0_g2~~TRINITY_DN5045_c0_g2_i1.p1  ORF type:complete len:326 (+),score=43.36 TRINITY_DN5045_c0_g2_i1:52-978(+)